MSSVRIDKWLWAARIFKTRSIATSACQAGKIKLNTKSVKASHSVKLGDRVLVTRPGYKQELEVTGLHDKRVSADKAAALYEDCTPPEEIEQLKLKREVNAAFFNRERGAGRPTKRERRRLDSLKGRD